MTTILPAPIIRAYHRPSKQFMPVGLLSLSNDFFSITQQGGLSAMNGIEIDLFTGRFAEDGNPVYLNDRVEVETPNEFGSLTRDTGVIKYDTKKMCYVITASLFKGNETPLPTKILKVTGHAHD